MAFVAVVRRFGGQFFKMPRCGAMGAVPNDTRPSNLGTYFTEWPKSLSTFLLYGSTRSFNTVTASQAPSSDVKGYLSTNRKKFTLRNLAKNYRDNIPIVMMTAYDAPIAAIADRCGIDLLLVGDSIGNVKLGYDSTVTVNMAELLVASGAVCRGAKNAFIIGDLPFGSYLTVEDALKNSSAMLKVGCDAVKLEGGARMADVIAQLTKCGIPVMAHIGLTPQSHVQQGGYGTQGKSTAAAEQLIADAKAVEAAGAFSCVLEKVPSELADIITNTISIPTIGIGAGPKTSGQVLVSDDLLGLSASPAMQNGSIKCPSFVKQYATLSNVISNAFSAYAHDVRTGAFPARAHSSAMPGVELAVLRQQYPEGVPHNEGGIPGMVGSGNTKNDTVDQSANMNGDKGEQQTKNLGAMVVGGVAATLGGAKAATRCAELDTDSDAMLPVVHTITDIRSFVRQQKEAENVVGFVPTMGKLHEGHLCLVEAAFKHCDVVVVSIFVNPSQFAAHEDFGSYPRDLEKDVAALKRAFPLKKVCVFAPSAKDMYPDDARATTLTTSVVPDGVRGQSEDAKRPSFFRGVATVCSMLFHIVSPDDVFFGQKDAMQCAVIRNMVRDLHFPVRVHVEPTVREANGLAMSSRNTYLNEQQKKQAANIYRVLSAATEQRAATAKEITNSVENGLVESGFEVDYVSVAEPKCMTELTEDTQVGAGAVLSVAVKMKDDNGMEVRLLDNVVF